MPHDPSLTRVRFPVVCVRYRYAPSGTLQDALDANKFQSPAEVVRLLLLGPAAPSLLVLSLLLLCAAAAAALLLLLLLLPLQPQFGRGVLGNQE